MRQIFNFHGIYIVWHSLLDKLMPFPVPNKTLLFYWPCYLEETESTFQMPNPISSTVFLCLLQSRCKRNLLVWEQKPWVFSEPWYSNNFRQRKTCLLVKDEAFSKCFSTKPKGWKMHNLNHQTRRKPRPPVAQAHPNTAGKPALPNSQEHFAPAITPARERPLHRTQELGRICG